VILILALWFGVLHPGVLHRNKKKHFDANYFCVAGDPGVLHPMPDSRKAGKRAVTVWLEPPDYQALERAAKAAKTPKEKKEGKSRILKETLRRRLIEEGWLKQ
jgi:hypothetical protein